MTKAPSPSGRGDPSAPRATPPSDPSAAAAWPGGGSASARSEGLALRDALLDSRHRWRDFVTLAADFAFETDAAGRFVFVTPDPAMGWSAATLLGQTAELLLAEPKSAGGFNPFRPAGPVRYRRAWLKRSDGALACLRLSVLPVLDEEGRAIGVRGIAEDVTEQERREAEVAAALRRGAVLEHMLSRLRAEARAPHMMRAVLEVLSHASGSDGLAMLDVLGDGIQPLITHGYGQSANTVVPTAMALLDGDSETLRTGMAIDGRRVLVCPVPTRTGEPMALVLWRTADSRDWDAEERQLVSASTALLRVILDHEAISREMARQVRIDPLTGLLTRRAFIDEMSRRFERLEVDIIPGALLLVNLDNFNTLNEGLGGAAADEALRIVGRLLRESVRPVDIVARLGGDEFAVWLDSAEELAAAERAEDLRVAGPAALAHLLPAGGPEVTLSIGIAARWPGRSEDVAALLQRADHALYEAKSSGRGAWKVKRAEDET